MKYPEDDVPLSDGHGYMVGKQGFDEYISKAPAPPSQVGCAPIHYSRNADYMQSSTCHEYDAIKNQNSARAHLDATGVGAIACGRHGCFYPHAVVNFKKGEG